MAVQRLGQQKQLFYTQEGWRHGVGEIQSVSSLVSKRSQELVFRQHLLDILFILARTSYILDILLCVPIQALMLGQMLYTWT